MNGKFHHFDWRDARRKLGRMIRGTHAGFKLQISCGCKSGRRGNCGATGIGFRRSITGHLTTSVRRKDKHHNAKSDYLLHFALFPMQPTARALRG